MHEGKVIQTSHHTGMVLDLIIIRGGLLLDYSEEAGLYVAEVIYQAVLVAVCPWKV